MLKKCWRVNILVYACSVQQISIEISIQKKYIGQNTHTNIHPSPIIVLAVALISRSE